VLGSDDYGPELVSVEAREDPAKYLGRPGIPNCILNLDHFEALPDVSIANSFVLEEDFLRGVLCVRRDLAQILQLLLSRAPDGFWELHATNVQAAALQHLCVVVLELRTLGLFLAFLGLQDLFLFKNFSWLLYSYPQHVLLEELLLLHSFSFLVYSEVVEKFTPFIRGLQLPP